MKRNLLLTLLLALPFWSINAQDCNRYLEEIFSEVSVTTVEYTEYADGSENKLMDIYQPVGDDYNKPRPVMIFAHGGSFLGGSKENNTVTELCNRYAKRGYVTASINYTLAPFAGALIDSVQMINVVMQAVGDGKAAVRYFRKDAATDNMYNVDSEQIFVGGNSAGAILSMHLAYLDYDEAPDYMKTIIDSHGGIEGPAGNDGYSSDVKAVINLAGGLNKLSFINEGEEPVVSAHGDADGVVPYDCNDVFWGDPIYGTLDLVDVCGSGTMHPVLDDNGIRNELMIFPGDNHVPWEGNMTKMNQVVDMVTNFIYEELEPSSLPSVDNPEVSLGEITYNSVELNWSAVEGASTYGVSYVIGDSEPVDVIVDGTSFIIEGAEQGDMVDAQVFAMSDSGCANSSGVAIMAQTLEFEVGINDDFGNGIKLYPNPANHTLYINLPITQNSTVRIVDITGKVITQLTDQNTHLISVNTSDLNNGMYQVQIENDLGIFNKKMVVSH